MDIDQDDLIQQIFFLRRYARLVAGSRERGDRYVAVTLENLLTEDESLASHSSRKLVLYRAFHKTWQRLSAQIDPKGLAEAENQSRLEDQVMALSPLERQALLLFVVERFSLEETAEILGIEPIQAEALLVEARDGIAARPAARVLIIEDEPLIALDMTRILRDMGHRVVGNASTHAEAVHQALAQHPDIVLADIQLADGSSGINAVAEILQSISVPVVFVTAYPERLLTGEGQEPTFLVTKPFDEETLSVVVDQALILSPASRPVSAAG